MKRFLIFLLLTGLVVSNGCKSPSTPEPPAKPACETNHTLDVTFQNKSARNYTYDIIWDGTRVATLAPWAQTTITVAAGSHTLWFKISNTNLTACQKATVNLAQCSNQTYWCTT